jgi:hypothetical protein
VTDPELLRLAAERASQHVFYLAFSLLAYARAERLDDAALAERLGCGLEQLPALLLCRRPTGEGAVLRADVEAIAARFGLSPVRLLQVLRHADALVSFERARADRAGGLLAAARDREADDPDPLHDHPSPADRARPDELPDEPAP